MCVAWLVLFLSAAVLLMGKWRVAAVATAECRAELERSLGEVSPLEYFSFGGAVLLIGALGRARGIGAIIPEAMGGIPAKRSLGYSMKVYGLGCGLLFGLVGSMLLLLSGRDGLEGALLLVAAVVGGFLLPESKFKKAVIERERSIKRQFPKILDKIVVMLEAGYSMAMVWRYLGEKCTGEDLVEREVLKQALAYRNGKPEEDLYKDLAAGLSSSLVMKFSNLCLQSLKKGSVDLVMGLKEISAESWQDRKWEAIKRGEEASGKMIIPLMLVFAGILIIVMVPALLQLTML